MIAVSPMVFAACGSVDASQRRVESPEAAQASDSPIAEAELASISPLEDLAGRGNGPTSAVAYANLTQPEIAACMSKSGWSYVPEVRPGDQSEPTDPSAAVVWAQTFGYGLLTAPSADATGGFRKAKDQNGAYQAGLDVTAAANYQDDLQSCSQAARDAHVDEFKFLNPAIREQAETAKTKVASSPDLDPAFAAWQKCVSDAGLPSDSWEAPRALFNAYVFSSPADPSVVQHEKDVATTDAKCRLQTLWPAQAALEQIDADRILAAASGHSTSTLG